MFLKRTFDIIFSILGILLFFPLFIIIGLIIILDSKGAITYKAKRVGRYEKEFIFYKFRTMHPNSDKSSITIGNNDSRITRFGYILRKTKLDELPQLFNVLIGDMSFVGPRPDVSKYKQYYKKNFTNYYKYKPGITCYSTIFFRNESELYEKAENPEKLYIKETIPQKIQLDKEYFRNISLINDIKIIFRTIKKILG